jgi:hypothetical protein
MIGGNLFAFYILSAQHRPAGRRSDAQVDVLGAVSGLQEIPAQGTLLRSVEHIPARLYCNLRAVFDQFALVAVLSRPRSGSRESTTHESNASSFEALVTLRRITTLDWVLKATGIDSRQQG